jgi:putative colanic acid biosynthesis acetyltransferase WcaF
MQPTLRPALEPYCLTLSIQVRRILWTCVCFLLYRPTPNVMHAWRRFVLRMFGATIGRGAHPYPRARIWAPWNLRMGIGSCLANDVDCYNVAEIFIDDGATVSQYAFLCSASHDFRDANMPLIAAPIAIHRRAWVTACAFVGPGVQVGEGAVIGACSVVTNHVEPWSIVVGNPARRTGTRVIRGPK